MGRHTFTEAEILEFGRRFDPQPFHTCSPGMDSVRWPAPVRAGDTLLFVREVLAARASATRPGVGLVKHRWEATNQRGDVTLAMEGWGMFGRRPAA